MGAGGIPHSLIQDDMYEGYLIPKGTMMFANTWAIHRDELEYYNPEEFIPERYMSKKFSVRNVVEEGSDNNRRITYGFGAGRRVCPGQRLAEYSLVDPHCRFFWQVWLTMSR